MTINFFKASKWTGYVTVDGSITAAKSMARIYFRSGEYDAVNVESASGTVLEVVR